MIKNRPRIGPKQIAIVGVLAGLGLYLYASHEVDERFTKEVTGTWETKGQAAILGKPKIMILRANHTYSFDGVEGTWHRSGNFVQLEQNSTDWGQPLELSEDKVALVDKSPDGGWLHRVTP